MKRLIVAMTGASGAIYGIRALEALRRVADIETHLIVSPAAAHTIAEETDISVSNVKALATWFIATGTSALRCPAARTERWAC